MQISTQDQKEREEQESLLEVYRGTACEERSPSLPYQNLLKRFKGSAHQRMTMRFKLRSSRRDESADARRLNSIRRSLSRAIDEATFEKEGLQPTQRDNKPRYCWATRRWSTLIANPRASNCYLRQNAIWSLAKDESLNSRLIWTI